MSSTTPAPSDKASPREAGLLAFTVMGARCMDDPRVRLCLDTWHNLGPHSRVRVLSDGTLSPDHFDILRDRYSFDIVSDAEIEAVVIPRLTGCSNLKNYLASIRHFKKAVYVPLLAAREQRALILDSDVFIACPITFPCNAPAVLVSPDDVPAYRLHWSTPFRLPVATCVNSGFVYFSPPELDIEYLEYCFERCRSRSRNTWWIEQASWALYTGKASSAGYFSGEDVRVIGALGKRTAAEVRRNAFAWHRAKHQVNAEEMRQHLMDAAVMHFAGSGKPWIPFAAAEFTHDAPRDIRWHPLPRRTLPAKALLALRLVGIEWKDSIRTLHKRYE